MAAIGLAGENRVYMAIHRHSLTPARLEAPGPVMGDKRLKAIAVRGTKDINLPDRQNFLRCAASLKRELMKTRSVGDPMAHGG